MLIITAKFLCNSPVVQELFSWILHLGFHKTTIKVIFRVGFSSEAQLGKDLLPRPLWLWQNLFPCDNRIHDSLLLQSQ